MAWQIGDPERCSAGLSGEMHAGQCHSTIFPDFSPATTIRRKTFNLVLKKMTALGLQPYLIYPVAIKLRHKGEQRSFNSPQKAEDFISSLSQRKTYALLYKAMGKWRPSSLRPGRRGLKAGWRRSQLPGRRWWQGGDGYLLNLFLFFYSSLLLGYCSYLSDTTVSLLVRLTPFFLFWRGLMESRGGRYDQNLISRYD